MIVSGLTFDVEAALVGLQVLVLLAQLRNWRGLRRARRAADFRAARYSDLLGYRNMKVR